MLGCKFPFHRNYLHVDSSSPLLSNVIHVLPLRHSRRSLRRRRHRHIPLLNDIGTGLRGRRHMRHRRRHRDSRHLLSRISGFRANSIAGGCHWRRHGSHRRRRGIGVKAHNIRLSCSSYNISALFSFMRCERFIIIET